ncbi:MAG: hypothetical protein RIM72_11630 [Alphaproteobacteria bacterium]
MPDEPDVQMPEQDARQSGTYLPATFAQRGVAVAFTTPVLSFARLRRARDDTLQYLVPGLAGGIETYVIPAASIADVVNLTVFDRHLMESIDGDNINLSPLTMRNISLKKATSGLAGAKRAKRARFLLEQDRKNNMQMLLLLVQSAIEQLSDEKRAEAAAGLTEESLRSGEAVACLQDHLGSFLGETGLTAEQAFARCQKWAACTSMVGSPDDRVTGPLKLLIRDLEQMSADLMSWLVPEPVGPAEMAQRVAVAATEAVSEARQILAFIDESHTDIGPPLKDWAATKPALREAVRRIAEILDGWRRIVDRWDRVADRERVDQREIVELFGLYMPVLPVEAVRHNTAFWEDIRATQKRWEHDAAMAARSLLDVDEKVHEKLHKYQKEVA